MSGVGRTKEFDEDEVLDRATEVFWRQGYKATSVRDLLVATGVGESSLYNAFGGKRGLFLIALERYRRMLSTYLKRLDEFESPLEAIRWLFDGVATGLSAQADFRGCLITNTTIELAPHDAEIQAELQSIYSEVEAAFYKVLNKARKRGELSTERPLRSLARYLTQNLEGLRVLAKSNPVPRAIRGMANTTVSLLFDDQQPVASRKPRAAKRRIKPAVQKEK